MKKELQFTNSASIGSRWKLHGLSLMMTIILLFTLALGNAWGASTYKMIENNAFNSNHFWTTAGITEDAKTIQGESCSHKLNISSAVSGWSSCTYNDRMVKYDQKTNSTTFEVYYNHTNTSTHHIYAVQVIEGGATTTKSKEIKTNALDSAHFTFASAENKKATVYFYFDNTKVSIYQIKATENGTEIPNRIAGKIGYSIDFDKARFILRSATEHRVDSCLILKGNNSCYPGNATYAQIKTKGTEYIQVYVSAACKMIVKTVTANVKFDVIASVPSSDGTYTKYTSKANDTIQVPVTAGTWYITPNGSNVQVSGIAFETAAAPSAAPSITAQPATAAANYEQDAAATALSVTATGSGTLTYQWYKNTTASNTSGTAISGATSASYTPSTAEAGTLYYYCIVTNTESGKSGTTATSNVSGAITVTYPATGSGVVIRYDLDVTNGGSTLQTTKVDAKASTLSVATSTTMLAGGLEKSSSKGTHNGTRTLGINTLAEETSSKYFYVTFSVADGYQFTPTAISLKVLTIGGNATSYKAVLTDGTNSITGTASATNDSELTLGSWDNLGTTALTGDVTLKLYAWYTTSGSYNAYRLSTPITITGDVAEVDVTAPTLSSSVPADEATGIDVSGNIVLTMSENVSVADASKFSLTGGAGSLTTGSITVSGAVITIPYISLANNTDYIFTAAAGAIKDGSNNLNAAFTIGFKTAASGVCVKPDAPIGLGVDVKTNNYAKFSWDGGSAGANGYQIALTSEAVGATGKFDWKDDATAIYEATNLTPATEYTFKVKYKGTVDDCFSDEVTETFTTYSACTELVPEISGEKPEVGDEILLQTGSAGGKIVVADKKDENSFSYSSYGLLFNSGGKDSVRVELNSLMKEGTVIALTIVSNGTSERGLNINKTGRATVYEATWTPAASGEEQFFTYVVTGSDGLKNTDKFWLARNGSVYLKSLTVSNCGDAIYDVTFDMKGHGTQVAKQTLTAGAKVAEPSEPEAAGYIFGGWYKETTLENAWNFSTDVVPSNDITLYAKWTEDPCTDRQSLSKVVLTSASEGTVTGYNGNEYAGTAIIAALSGTKSADLGDGSVTGYKLSSGGNSIIMATLKKGNFQEGDKVTVGIVYQNDQRTVDASTNIMTIYAGSDKDHMMEVTTLTGVTGAGYYTYRLTAADATAINTAGYKSIGLFRASSNGENHYVYSVEITGCRSWTTTHTVTYNKMGKGADIAPAVVAVGDLVPKPSVVEPDGWALVGWFKEEGLVNEWNFASDVMPDNNLTLYAKWEDETGVIKLFDGEGNLNTTNFVSAAKKDGGIDIDEVNYPCLVDFGSNRTSLNGTTQADVVQYNATTNTAKIKLDLYNNATGAKTAYLWMVEEGATESGDPIAINVPGKTRLITSYTSFNSEKPRSFYVTSGSKSDIKVLQVKVLDNGTDIPQFGKAGYAVNLNKGRIIAAANGTVPFDGATMHSNDAYTVLNSSNFKPKTYIQFNNAVANTTVKITKASSNKYYVTNDLDNKGDEYSTDQEIVLTTTGTWYIGSVNSGSVAALSKIEFVAPKCEEPTITTQPATNVTFGAGNLTATVVAEVSDGGTLSYQWYNASDDSEVTGADEATLTTITEGTYYVIVTNTLADHQANSTKSDEATLRYRTLNDATLSALSYGDPETSIALEADKYEYRVILSEGTTEVPALHATATMDPYPTVTITDAASFTDYNAQSTVHVTAEDGVTELTYTVNFIVKHIYTSLEDVTESTTWNWIGSVDQTINDVPNKGVIIANYIEGDNFEMIEGKAGEYARRNQNSGVYQGTYLHFNTTVPGRVKFYFRAPSGGENCTITVKNGGRTVVAGTRTNSFGWSDEVFVNGDVVVEMVNDKEGGGTTRVQQVVFTTADPNYTRPVTEGRFGTICLPNGGVMVGAALFEVAYHDATLEKIFFDEILNGEMVAGRPYIFLPNEGVSALAVTYTDAADAPAGNYHGLYGSYTQEVLAQEAGNYILYNNQYMYVGASSSNVSVGANRAYFKIGVEGGIPTNAVAPLPGRRRVSMSAVRETPTGLENGELINGENGVQKVLINGELFILRGEKMYDATGRLVK